MNRRFHHGSAWQINERAIFPERGIQGGKRVLLQPRQPIQMRRDPSGWVEQRLAQAGDQARSGIPATATTRRITAIDERQAVRRQIQRRQAPASTGTSTGRCKAIWRSAPRSVKRQASCWRVGQPIPRSGRMPRGAAGDGVRFAAVGHERGEGLGGRGLVGRARRRSWRVPQAQPGAPGPVPRCTARNPVLPVPAPGSLPPERTIFPLTSTCTYPGRCSPAGADSG
jgi:hypothetical protein